MYEYHALVDRYSLIEKLKAKMELDKHKYDFDHANEGGKIILLYISQDKE